MDGEPKPVKDFMEALDAGFRAPLRACYSAAKVPDKTLAEDAPMASRIAGSIGQLAGDVPAMVGGALLGGANPYYRHRWRLRAPPLACAKSSPTPMKRGSHELG